MDGMIRILAASAATLMLATSAGPTQTSPGAARDRAIQVGGPAPYAMAAADANEDLDPSFGNSGTVVLDLGPESERGRAIALQPDGKILAGGTGQSGSVLARLSSVGTLDPSFGSGGVAPSVGSGDVAVQADGKVVVAGAVELGPGFCCRFAVGRYGPNGTPDTSFGDNGVVVLDFAFYARAVAIQPDGRIVAAGALEGGTYAMAVARLESDGTPDTTFGGDGTVLTTFDGDSGADGLALQPDGKIVVVGYAGWYNAPTSHDFALVRYNTDGSLDTTFGGDGKVTTDFGGSTNYERFNQAHAVAIQADGRIVVAGDGALAAVARYNEDGSLDTAFDGDGIATTGRMQQVNDLGIDPTGRIVIGGSGSSQHSGDLALARFDAGGSVDGFTVVDMGLEGSGQIEALGIQPDGHVVVAGSAGISGSTHSEWVLARFRSIRSVTSLVATPAAVGFGDVVVGGAPAQATVTVTNPGGSANVAISLVQLSGDPAAGISITSQGCPLGPLGPAASCEIGLSFAPPSPGTAAAELTIASDATSGTLVIPIMGTGILPPSGVTWGTTYAAGPAYTWNSGNALGRTVQSGAQRLHLAYATYRVGGRWATDTGPYAGVYYVKSSSGSSWTTPYRVNPTNQHALRLGLAAAGSRVYVAWATQARIDRYSGTAPRVLYVRVNTNHGTGGYWKSPVRLTSTAGRVDYPVIAADGYDVHVAWTDSATGSVKVATSRDRGATWKTTSLGSASYSTSSGRMGYPSVAVSGSTVAVTWLADKYGTIRARVSTNRGVSWGTTVTLATGTSGITGVAVRGSRIAVAWTTADEMVLRQRVGGTWGKPVVVAALALGATSFPYSPAVVLQDPDRVGVAWAEAATSTTSSLRWAESADGGTTWFATQALASSSSSRRLNDFPSVQWPSAATRYVAWNGWTANSTSYRLYLRRGSGAPVGPTSLAPAWEPAGAADVPALLPLGDGGGWTPVAPDGRREAPLLPR